MQVSRWRHGGRSIGDMLMLRERAQTGVLVVAITVFSATSHARAVMRCYERV